MLEFLQRLISFLRRICGTKPVPEKMNHTEQPDHLAVSVL